MANVYEPSEGQLAEWEDWKQSQPESVRAVADKLSPWKLYRMKPTQRRVIVKSFDERNDGTITLTVNVSGDYNFVMVDRDVFGILPENLEECGLPSPDELVDSVM